MVFAHGRLQKALSPHSGAHSWLQNEYATLFPHIMSSLIIIIIAIAIIIIISIFIIIHSWAELPSLASVTLRTSATHLRRSISWRLFHFALSAPSSSSSSSSS
eukprot:6348120-Karenia_brevis.AAC.1